jgi:hypothetical protein
MLSFATDWSWALKSILATLILALMTVGMMYTQKHYNYGGEKFLFAWYVGIALSFMFFAHLETLVGTNPNNWNMSGLFDPFWVFVAVAVGGFVLGSVANIFLGQAIDAASNPGSVWAIIGANAPLSYVAVYWLAKAYPNDFPVIEFHAVNFAGILLILVGVVMVMYKPT